MRILVAHNYYQQRGGEDLCFAAEADLFDSYGHDVTRYSVHNDVIDARSSMSVAASTVWNQQSYRELRALMRERHVEVAIFQNTFPLISPAAYYAAKAENVAVVQVLHNYRIRCANATFFREGHTCEDCLYKVVPWPGVLHACYRGSRSASAVVATMLSVHRALGTWRDKVHIYIALTGFAKDKFVQAGIARHQIVVKPNFLHPAPEVGDGNGGYALFVGRLSPEKGLGTLLKAWSRLEADVTLKIVGDGPLRDEVAEASERTPKIEWLGAQPHKEVTKLMQHAMCLVFPSQWYEGLPRVIIEAFAAGTPVVASDLGAMSSLVKQEVTGLRFPPGDSEALASKIDWIHMHRDARRRLRSNARSEFEDNYSAERNYQMYMAILESALERAR